MIRTGTTRFWDMYWHPEATGAGGRATPACGRRSAAPLFDLAGDTEEAQATALAQTSSALAELGPARIDPALAPHSIYTVSEELAALDRRDSRPSAALPIQIHLSETEPEVERLRRRATALRPAAYLDRLGLLGRAHRARPRRLARPRASSS